ncbi:MAG: hypothetical protein H8D23_10890 [Candidatus Brocadiales bacterium]|nr:hypothetical protein [Candidatus Brocadiales bacterium]
MQTDVDLLPVYNKLYNLELDDAEVERITTKIDKLSPTKYSYSFIANKTLVRLYPKEKYWRRHNNVELIPYDDDSDPDEVGGFIGKTLIPNLPCYTLDDFDKEFIFKEFDVLKLDKEDKEMLPFAAQLLRGDVDKDENPITQVIDSIDDLKAKLKDKFLNTFISNQYIENKTKGLDVPHSKLMGWIFDIEMTDCKSPGRLRDQLDFIQEFIEIGESDNIRIGVSMCAQTSYYRQNFNTAIMIADCENPVYDYMDKGRQYFAPDLPIGYNRHSKEDINTMPKSFLLNDQVRPAQKAEVFTDIENRNTDKKVLLVDSMMLETVIKRFQRRDTLAADKVRQKDVLKAKFKKKLDKLGNNGSTLNLNGVKLGKNSIEYAGQSLSCDQIETASLVAKYAGYRGLDDFNFDTVSDDFFNELTNRVERSWKTDEWTGKIGDIDFKIENKVNVNKAGATMRLVYINDYKIKKDEVGDIIRRGLCYDDQAVFDGFCHQVSKCSLKLHKYLNEGVQLKVYDDYKHKTINFKIPLIRKSGKNFIVLDEKEYGVADSNRLIKLQEAGQMHEAINVLLNPKVVRIDGPADIAHIIGKGTELHEQDKDKNRKLIEKVENIFDISVTNITNNGARQRGYVIDGKMSKYFLDIGRTDRETVFDRLRVFSYPDMGYVCMIDKTVEQTGPSNLINRIFALHNDSLVARDVHTLNQQN